MRQINSFEKGSSVTAHCIINTQTKALSNMAAREKRADFTLKFSHTILSRKWVKEEVSCL